MWKTMKTIANVDPNCCQIFYNVIHLKKRNSNWACSEETAVYFCQERIVPTYELLTSFPRISNWSATRLESWNGDKYFANQLNSK